EYGVNKVFIYEHPELSWFRADCYTDVVADCIAEIKPSSVLIGGTELGRSLAPRLSTRFHTGLTADCTQLDIKPNTDMIRSDRHLEEISWRRSQSPDPDPSLPP